MSKVSVIVPLYNAEKYLKQCVDSILQQTYSDLEVLLVDDGSTDNSAALCKDFADKDTRVQYVYQENAGPDYARKKGVEISTGEYLLFIDADDYADKEMIQRLYEELTQRDCDVVCSQVKRVNGHGKVWEAVQGPKEDILCQTVQESMYHFFVTRYLSGSYYAKLFRRELLQDYNFVKDSLIGEDITAVLYAIQRAKKIYIMRNAFYYYYWNEDSISHSGYTDRHYVSLLNYISIRDELLTKKYIESKYIAGFFAEYEMAVATAMSRNWKKDSVAIETLREDLRKNCRCILHNPQTPFYMKACILLFCGMPGVFMRLYRILFILTGR